MKKRLVVPLALLIVSAGFRAAAQSATPGTVFQDCPACPELVVIAPGSFNMGELGHTRSMPVHKVTIARPFSIGKYQVTFDEWDACVADNGCGGLRPNDGGWGRGRRPVINVSWDDAQSYVGWLSRKTGKPYRLPTEAEWEYAARAGASTYFPWGDDIGRGKANCDGCGSPFDNKQTAPVGSFPANAFGLHDAVGNVTEWVEDRWHSDYTGAPTDGSPWQPGDPLRVVLRKGAWYNSAARQHLGYRTGDSPRVKNGKIGFRVALSSK